MRTTQSQCVMRGQAETMLMGSDDHTHNGWRNYETWTIVSWIDNEEWLSANAARLTLESSRGWRSDPWSTAPIVGLADALDEWMQSEVRIDEDETVWPVGHAIAEQLFQSAWDNIDWIEISKSFLNRDKDDLEAEARRLD